MSSSSSCPTLLQSRRGRCWPAGDVQVPESSSLLPTSSSRQPQTSSSSRASPGRLGATVAFLVSIVSGTTSVILPFIQGVQSFSPQRQLKQSRIIGGVNNVFWRLHVDVPHKQDVPIMVLSDDPTTAGPPSPFSSSSSSNTPSSTRRTTLPWSKVQDWALRDNLPKYVIRIPMKVTDKNNDDNDQVCDYSSTSPSSEDAATTRTSTDTTTIVLTTFALWRSLLQDVPELAGYPVDFLQFKYQEQQKKRPKDDADDGDDDDDDDDETLEVKGSLSSSLTMVGILPYLHDYEFTAQGGVCGTVYGLVGVADGSRIETSFLEKVQETVPQGYIQTAEGVAFEVGRPLAQGETNNGATPWKILSLGTAGAAPGPLVETATQQGSQVARTAIDQVQGDDLLIRLGATTGIVLAGALALNMLSHHMTVNMFWV